MSVGEGVLPAMTSRARNDLMIGVLKLVGCVCPGVSELPERPRKGVSGSRRCLMVAVNRVQACLPLIVSAYCCEYAVRLKGVYGTLYSAQGSAGFVLGSMELGAKVLSIDCWGGLGTEGSGVGALGWMVLVGGA